MNDWCKCLGQMDDLLSGKRTTFREGEFSVKTASDDVLLLRSN
ncbi:MAG: hypothetical protein AAFV25_22715 [Bacteroidota bacterium]